MNYRFTIEENTGIHYAIDCTFGVEAAIEFATNLTDDSIEGMREDFAKHELHDGAGRLAWPLGRYHLVARAEG